MAAGPDAFPGDAVLSCCCFDCCFCWLSTIRLLSRNQRLLINLELAGGFLEKHLPFDWIRYFGNALDYFRDNLRPFERIVPRVFQENVGLERNEIVGVLAEVFFKRILPLLSERSCRGRRRQETSPR